MRELYTRAAFVVGPLQEVPSPDSRVTLEPRVATPTACRPRGCSPAGPSPTTSARPTFLAARAEDWLRASGARRTHRAVRPAERTQRRPAPGRHLPHGTRPAHVGHRPCGRVWGHAGVTIADGSLHVTNGGVNPVLTILALAWRVSEDLAAELGSPRIRAPRG